MAKKLLCYLAFYTLEAAIILASLVVVVCLYLPFVVLKGAYDTLTGRATPRVGQDPGATTLDPSRG